jgi:hypothetical protein
MIYKALFTLELSRTSALGTNRLENCKNQNIRNYLYTSISESRAKQISGVRGVLGRICFYFLVKSLKPFLQN